MAGTGQDVDVLLQRFDKPDETRVFEKATSERTATAAAITRPTMKVILENRDISVVAETQP